MSRYKDDVTFTITCTMRSRWVPVFLGMLKEMQKLGGWGSSRYVTIYADGDGDFRPSFNFDASLPVGEPAEAKPNGDTFWDAG